MDSFSLIGFLPDKMVIWIQFGTRYFIDYIYLIIGIPLLVDLLIVWSPKIGLRFGGSDADDQKNESMESESRHSINLDESFKFMYVFARNPNLFQSKDSVENLDKEIHRIKTTISTGGNSDTLENKGGGKNSNNKKKNKKEISYSLMDRLLKNGISTLHLTFIAVVVIVNAIGFWHYSTMVDKYFKLSERGYSINYPALDIAPIEDREEVFRMQVKIEQINEVKYPEIKVK